MTDDLEDAGIRDAERFFNQHYRAEVVELRNNYGVHNHSIEIDYEDLERELSPTAELIHKNPRKAVSYLEEGLKQSQPEFVEHDLDPIVRPINLPMSRMIKDVHTGLEGELVSVRATVDKIMGSIEEMEVATFDCERCGAVKITVEQDGAGSSIREPAECPACETNGPFSVRTEDSELTPYQKIRLKELPEDRDGVGTQGDELIAHLRYDLIDEVSPGDRVEVNGVVNVRQIDDKAEFRAELEAKSIEHEQSDLSNIDLSAEDEQDILELAEEGDVFRKVRDSIAPGIYGLDTAKEAIALQLASGVRGDTKRGQIHILLIGDPGTGKSEILSSAATIHPRSIRTSGEGSTGTGLTAAAVKDDFGDGTWTVEAGALPSAHRGLAAVDELDKMADDDRTHLNSALADGVVSIAKAGISARLPAAASLLSAANPKYGRFDEYEGVAEQIELEPSLISRFDLIFTVTDEPDEEEDEKKADKILDTNYTETKRERGEDPEEYAEETDPAIDHDLLRKYLAYATQQVVPVVVPGSDASERLKEYFAVLRQQGEDGSVPITPRQLPSLARLAEASARIRLSEEVEMIDVERAIRITTESLEDVGNDPETGNLDADVLETGHSSSQRERIKGLIDIIQEITDERDGGKAPKQDILDAAEDQGISREKAEAELESLMRNGELMEPAHGHYRVV